MRDAQRRITERLDVHLAKLHHRRPAQVADLSAQAHRHDSSSFTFSRS